MASNIVKLDAVSDNKLLTPKKHDTYAFIDPLQADLSGKTVVITGATKGIGRALAISFARAGASGIVLLARSELSVTAEAAAAAAKRANRRPPQIVSIKCDVSTREDCEKAAREVGEKLGRVDILLNNAGFLPKFEKIVDSDPDEWWKAFEVNIKGIYLVCRAFVPLLLKGELKTIVNTSSIGGISREPGGSAYQVSKQAVVRLTDFLITDYGEDGLLAYCIHPGAVKTELASGLPDYIVARLIDEPELPGDTTVWLTKERRTWLAGRYINSTWDMEELSSKQEQIEKDNLLRIRLRQ